MDIVRAKELLSALADGIDPFTGELLPQNHVCNQPEMIRAFHELLNVIPSPKKKNLPRNAGKPWTDIEEEKLLESRLADLGKITDTYFNRKPR